jgi:hypothetical protein
VIVLSSGIVLAPAVNPLNTPIFGIDNVVTIANVSSTSEQTGFPIGNVATPETHVRWRANPAPATDEYVTVLIDREDPLDYLAVAVHNFGSAQIPVSVDGATELIGSSVEDFNWTELVQDSIPADDAPLIFRFTPQSLMAIRLRMQPGLAAPFASVIYAGKLLVADRGTHTSHTPITLGRTTRTTNAKSENGQFLGRITLSESNQTTFALKCLRDAWYTAHMNPFIVRAQETPFFFAWKPQQRPADVGYCTLRNDPQPVIDFDTDTVGIDLQLAGVSVR